MGGLFDPNAARRSVAEWRVHFAEAIAALSRRLAIELAPTSWFVHDDRSDHRSASNTVDVRGSVNRLLRLDVCGTVSIDINFGEAVWSSADLLVFAGGRRLRGPEGLALMTARFDRDGWHEPTWVVDAFGEWESHATDARWRDE